MTEEKECAVLTIIFWAVCDITSIVFLDLLGAQRMIMNISVDRVILVTLIGEYFEKGGTT